MKETQGRFDHLITNLERISPNNSIFNYEFGRKAFLSLTTENLHDWLETLLPNTRLILEPEIIGYRVGIQYINGNLNKAINKTSGDITEKIMSISNVPKCLPIKKRIEIQGILYDDAKKSDENKKSSLIRINQFRTEDRELRFCAFRIFHCNLNQFQALKELKNLCFEVPPSQFTNFISDFEIYHQCWKQKKLFKSYPTSGIVLKINSRRFQKYLGENNLLIHWAYVIK